MQVAGRAHPSNLEKNHYLGIEADDVCRSLLFLTFMKKTRSSVKIFLLLLFSSASLNSFAQPKIKYGSIAIEDLQMSRYELDSSALAVILYDKGHLDADTHLFTRHLRLKVIESGGTSYANFRVRTSGKSEIQGVTYNLVNSQIEETKLKNENIYREEIVEGFYIYKIFFPSVKPGSVIDLKYSFIGVPFEWRFQDRIPVKYSELVLEPTRFIRFKKTAFGTQSITNSGYKWMSANMPAFLEEPYMCHYSNYLAHFKFDLQTISIPGLFYREYSSSWPKVGQFLMDHSAFGGLLRDSPFLNETARVLKKSNDPILLKIWSAYRYIQDNIKWNGWESQFATNYYAHNFKNNHSGNAAEVNLLLIALLRKAGIDAYPVVLSTRDNGMLHPASASINSLNYVVGYVKMDGLELLLDATDPDLIPGLLPERCRNVSAFVIDSPHGWWLDTNIGKSNVRKHFINLKFEESGELTGDITITHEDYGYLEWIRKFKEAGSEEAYSRSVIANTTDVDVKSCTVSIDSKNMKAIDHRTVHLDGSEYVDNFGNEILINPFIFSDISNPFKLNTRMYPVDFLYPKSRVFVMAFHIPSDYSLRNLPEPFILKHENGGATFSMLSSLHKDLLTIKCSLNIARQIFTENEYASLKTFFSEVNRTMSKAIHIDKKL